MPIKTIKEVLNLKSGFYWVRPQNPLTLYIPACNGYNRCSPAYWDYKKGMWHILGTEELTSPEYLETDGVRFNPKPSKSPLSLIPHPIGVVSPGYYWIKVKKLEAHQKHFPGYRGWEPAKWSYYWSEWTLIGADETISSEKVYATREEFPPL